MPVNDTSNKVLLIGWDAADWRVITPLLEQGKMPNLQRMIEQGVKGNIATLYPVLSPMLWTSIATGKRAWKHGIHGFSEPDPSTGSIRPITHLSRKTKTIWNILNQKGKQSNVVGWWPSHPAEPINGVMVSNHFQQATTELGKPWPMRPGTVHPSRLHEILKDYRIHPMELDGDDLLPFVPSAPNIDQKKDKRLVNLAKTTAECSGIHAAATAIMQLESWDFMAVYYDAIDHYSHGFMRFHPPRQSFVSKEDFEMYSKVIEGAYIYHDMMLGTLLTLAGEETNVILISDHGFHPNHLRPQFLPNEPAGPAAEHRGYGILVAKGPHIKQDELVFGATLLDVAPTILTLFDLPLGQDMDGKPLAGLFREEPKIKTIPSWDEVKGDDGRHLPNMQMDPVESQASLKQLVDLGYIDPPDEDQEKATAETVRELQYNLAQAYMGGHRYVDAARILKELWETWPEESRFGVKWHACCVANTDAEKARHILETLKERKKVYAAQALEDLKAWNEKRKKDPEKELDRKEQFEVKRMRSRASFHQQAFHFLEAETLKLEGKPDASLESLNKAITTQTQLRPSVLRNMAECHIQLGEWNEAQSTFEKALELDEEDAHAWLGICRCHLHQRHNLLAASAAQKSVGLYYFNPQAHYLFGVALHRCNRIPLAIQALQMAVQQNPTFPKAYERLADIFSRRVKDTVQAEHYRKLKKEADQRIRHFKAGKLDTTAPSESEVLTDSAAISSACTFLDKPFSEVITIVSGLPRSGTSMMMQMLKAGGFPLLVDQKRKADESNPEGYYETELARQLLQNNAWIHEALGRGAKVVAPLLSHLAPKYEYRVIYMERDLDEIVRSQSRMLERLGKSGANRPPEDMKRMLKNQDIQARSLMIQHPKMASLIVSHRQAMDDPGAVVKAVLQFIDPTQSFQPKLGAMASAVKTELYRERAGVQT